MIRYIRYETSTGRITNKGRSVSLAIAQGKAQAHQSVYILLEGEHAIDGHTHYIDGSGLPALRMASTAVWDTQVITTHPDRATLSGLPIPCNIQINGDTVEVTDGSLEFSAENAGDYLVVLDDPAYLRKEWILDVD